MRADERFEELYRAEFAPVFRTIYLLCRDRGLAEEATQEAFARALERWGRLGDQPWVGGWVTTTALNVARRGLRRRPSIPEIRAEAEEDETIDLWNAVRSLPIRQQQAIVLRYRMDMSVEDVAGVMGCEAASVRGYLARGRQRLREVLGHGFRAER